MSLKNVMIKRRDSMSSNAEVSEIQGKINRLEILSRMSESNISLSAVASVFLPVSHFIDPSAQINKMETLMATRAIIMKNTDVNLYFSGHSREQGGDWACNNQLYISPDDINELCENRTSITLYLDCNYAELWAERFQ